MSDSIEQLVAAQEKVERERAALNAAPLSAITHETLDAAIAAAQVAGLWDRHTQLNGRKLGDLHSRMDPRTGQILSRREDTGVTHVSASVAPPVRRSPEELNAQLAAIEAELADHSRNVRDLGRMQELRLQHAAVKNELRERKGVGF